MKNAIRLLFIFSIIPTAFLIAQSTPATFSLGKETGLRSSDETRPLSNSAVELIAVGDSLWIAGGKGLDLATEMGMKWRHVGSEAPFDQEDVAAVGVHGQTIWVSLAGSEKVEGTSIPKGLGLGASTDGGATWTRVKQPMETPGDSTFVVSYGANQLKALAITTDFNNITYDIAVTSQAVWIASFAGGLRRSTDGGKSFEPVVLPPDFLDSISINDTLAFDLSPVDRPDKWNLKGTAKGMRGNFNHRVFSVMAANDSTIWVGTAGGINRTTDNGKSWRKFSYSNQQRPISGNFVVALGLNTHNGQELLWASTINAMDPNEFRSVSYSADNGNSWTTVLRGEFTHNFGFKDSIVYAATNSGVFRSDDAGRTWSQHAIFIDTQSRNRSTVPNCYAVASQGRTVWVANADGLMRTEDSPGSFFGTTWTLLRAAQSVGSISNVYAYPNPFAPDDEVCRVRYRTTSTGSVSIKVFDYGMFPVRTIVQNATRPPDTEHDEIWDGKTDKGEQAANGLYYIQVKVGDNDPAWTKVIVLQ